MVVLDTNLMSLLLFAGAEATRRLLARLGRLPAHEAVTTIVTFEESMRGWLSHIADAKTVAKQIEAYQMLGRQQTLYCKVRVLPFNEQAATVFQRLKKQYRRVGTMDLKIASVVVAHDALLLSQNLRDFQQIPGLRVEDWTKEEAPE